MDIDELQNFPNLFIFDQLRIIDQIISMVGSECNPDEFVLSILSSSLQNGSPGGRIEISKRLPIWLKKHQSILKFLPETEKKIIYLETFLSDLESNKETVDQEHVLNQIAEIISNSNKNEYQLLVAKLPEWIQEYESVFYHLGIEDKIKILSNKLTDTQEINTKPIIHQISQILSEISEHECQKFIIQIPNWAREEEEIFHILSPEEKIKILSQKLAHDNIGDNESILRQIADILSKSNAVDREYLIQFLPRKSLLYNSIFIFLPFEKRLSYLLNNFLFIENQNKSPSTNEFEEFLDLKISNSPEIKNLRRSQLQEWIATEYKEWQIELLRQEQEKASIQQFANLKGKYLATSYNSNSPLSPLYPILIQIDSGEFLEEEQIQFLKQSHLFGVLAVYYQMIFERTKEPWELVKASGYWRDNSQPNKSIQITEYLLSKCNLLNPRIKAAIYTTRGGAFRDLHRLDDAIQCANLAIQVNESNYYAYNLLGALYFESGDAEKGETCFIRALELGAPPRSQEEQMMGALKNARQTERQAVARYLSQRDPAKYKWAFYYL